MSTKHSGLGSKVLHSPIQWKGSFSGGNGDCWGCGPRLLWMRQVGFTRDHDPGRGLTEVSKVCLQSSLIIQEVLCVPVLNNCCSRSLWMLCDCKGPFRPNLVMWLPGLPAQGELDLYNGSDCSSLGNVPPDHQRQSCLSVLRGKVLDFPGWVILTKIILQTYSFLDSQP